MARARGMIALAALVACGAPLAGCQTWLNLREGGPLIDSNVWMLKEAPSKAPGDPNSPADPDQASYLPPACTEKVKIGNDTVDLGMLTARGHLARASPSPAPGGSPPAAAERSLLYFEIANADAPL